MKIMKKYILFVSMTAILFISQSCEDFLKEEMVSDISSKSYYTTNEGLEDALNACYYYLKDKEAYFSMEEGANLGIIGTDLFAHASDGSGKDINNCTYDPSHKFIYKVWNTQYQAINQCNAVVKRAGENTTMAESKKNVFVAEARFLRALYYFILVQQWGDVHLTLEETVSVEVDANKTSREQIYSEAIIPDLEFAISTLPVTQDDYGRATKYAAQMLLAKVYLAYAWQTGNSGDFQKAISNAEAVINSGEYSLLPDFADIWRQDNQKNAEVIFAIQNSHDVTNNGEGNRMHLFFLMEYDKLPGMMRTIEYGRPWKRFAATPFALSLWNREIDARYYKSFRHVWYANNPDKLLSDQAIGDTAIFIPGVNVGETYYVADANGNRQEHVLSQEYVDSHHGIKSHIITPLDRGGSTTGYDLKRFPVLEKHYDSERPDVSASAGTRDFFIFRLAEAYLIVAEAAFKVGDNNKAADMLNMIRRRAAWPGFESEMEISASDVTLDFILNERGRELIGEQKRWCDLTRTGTFIERVKAYCNATNYPNYPVDNITEKHLLRPYPQTFVDACKNGYEQNPGW